MKMKTKAADFDRLFPLMGVKDGTVISKRGEATVGWELSLPEAYSLSEDGYDSMIEAFTSAVRLLPPWTMVHRQDIFTYDEYEPERKDSFLGDSYEKHFGGRKYLNHRSFLYLTISVKGSALKNVGLNGLVAGKPGDGKPSDEAVEMLLSKADEFISIATSSGLIKARRLTDDDYCTVSGEGILDRQLGMWSDDGIMTDLPSEGDHMEAADRHLWAFVINESEQLPTSISSIRRIEALSTAHSELDLSGSSPLGVLLDCDHVVNQYILTAPQTEILSTLDARRRRMVSMSNRSAANRLNAEEIQVFIDEAHSESLTAVYSHTNVLVWGPKDERSKLRGRISAALAGMGVTCVQDTYDTPVLWYAAFPGAACEIGAENLMLMELQSSLCLGIWETFSKGIAGGSLKMCDRIRGVPLTLDLQQKALEAGLIDNYNAFFLGASGTGKSFFTNYFVRSCYDAGETVFIIDVGDSYELLCQTINEETEGRDGIYYKWDNEHPISFDAFSDYSNWMDERGHLRQDNNSLNFLVSFIQMLWHPAEGWTSATTPVLRQFILEFILSREGNDEKPIFDDFYVFMEKVVSPKILSGTYMSGDIPITQGYFDISKFCVALKEFSLQGAYDFLLNDRHPADIAGSRFTVFEVESITSKDMDTFYPLVILCIMNAFDMKMRSTDGFKVMVIEEAWKAIMSESTAPYLTCLWKTARKYRTSAVVVTQQLSDMVSSPIVRDTIIANSSVKALLEHTGGMSSFEQISDMLSLDSLRRNLILSINRNNSPKRPPYREVFISLGSRFCGVFAHEVSPEERLAYDSDKVRKVPLLSLASRKGVIPAIKETLSR